MKELNYTCITAHMIEIHRSNKTKIMIHISKIHNRCLPSYMCLLYHSFW